MSVFFFQAEDGIRDHCVTGVQTCALPISTPHTARRTPPAGTDHRGVTRTELRLRSSPRINERSPAKAMRRSEERRVGKECRARWLGAPVKIEERGRRRDDGAPWDRAEVDG